MMSPFLSTHLVGFTPNAEGIHHGNLAHAVTKRHLRFDTEQTSHNLCVEDGKEDAGFEHGDRGVHQYGKR